MEEEPTHKRKSYFYGCPPLHKRCPRSWAKAQTWRNLVKSLMKEGKIIFHNSRPQTCCYDAEGYSQNFDNGGSRQELEPHWFSISKEDNIRF
ncbi:hypothetical protein AMTRI_Chr13g122400 [Amborella trichopoda]